MMPLTVISQKLVQDPRVIDISAVGAALEFHGLTLTVSNALGSDCGHRWMADIRPLGVPVSRPSTAPDLRTALLKEFDDVLLFRKAWCTTSDPGDHQPTETQ